MWVNTLNFVSPSSFYIFCAALSIPPPPSMKYQNFITYYHYYFFCTYYITLMTKVTFKNFIFNSFLIALELQPSLFSLSSFPPWYFFPFLSKLDFSENNDLIFMKKLKNIDVGAFNNVVYLFLKIRYSLRDFGKIFFLSRVTPLSPISVASTFHLLNYFSDSLFHNYLGKVTMECLLCLFFTMKFIF